MPFNPKEFPLLNRYNYRVTSEVTPEYNCIAWAAGDQGAWWWPHPTAFWPESAPREVTLDAFVKAYESIGYEVCEDRDLEKGFEKIAVFAKAGVPTHAARQLKDGRWTSKLGPQEDIEHELGGIEGPAYGAAVLFMRRKRG